MLASHCLDLFHRGGLRTTVSGGSGKGILQYEYSESGWCSSSFLPETGVEGRRVPGREKCLKFVKFPAQQTSSYFGIKPLEGPPFGNTKDFVRVKKSFGKKIENLVGGGKTVRR